jgi:hypothetical protein
MDGRGCEVDQQPSPRTSALPVDEANQLRVASDGRRLLRGYLWYADPFPGWPEDEPKLAYHNLVTASVNQLLVRLRLIVAQLRDGDLVLRSESLPVELPDIHFGGGPWTGTPACPILSLESADLFLTQKQLRARTSEGFVDAAPAANSRSERAFLPEAGQS